VICLLWWIFIEYAEDACGCSWKVAVKFVWSKLTLKCTDILVKLPQIKFHEILSMFMICFMRMDRVILTFNIQGIGGLYLYKGQHSELFIFTVLNYHTCACFGPICSTSSGDSTCIYDKWYLFFLRSRLSVDLDGIQGLKRVEVW
jgi:hypothetical protein